MSRWRFIKSWLFYTWGGLHRYFGNKNTLASEHERAVHYFTKAYDIDPQFRQALLSRAILLGRELNRPEEALIDFDALLADDPHFGPALINRGLLLQENGRYREALRDINAYLNQNEWRDHHKEAQRIVPLLQAILEDLDQNQVD